MNSIMVEMQKLQEEQLIPKQRKQEHPQRGNCQLSDQIDAFLFWHVLCEESLTQRQAPNTLLLCPLLMSSLFCSALLLSTTNLRSQVCRWTPCVHLSLVSSLASAYGQSRSGHLVP